MIDKPLTPNSKPLFPGGWIQIERIVTGIVGSLFILIGLIRRTVLGMLLIASGAYLFVRSISGVPYLSDLLGSKEASGQSSRKKVRMSQEPPLEVEQGDVVTQAVWESFPASDPPAWTTGE